MKGGSGDGRFLNNFIGDIGSGSHKINIGEITDPILISEDDRIKIDISDPYINKMNGDEINGGG